MLCVAYAVIYCIFFGLRKINNPSTRSPIECTIATTMTNPSKLWAFSQFAVRGLGLYSARLGDFHHAHFLGEDKS